MGQSISQTNEENALNEGTIEYINQEEISKLFQTKLKLLLKPLEAKAITQKSNVTTLNEKNVLTPSDLAYLLEITSEKCEDNDAIFNNYGFTSALKVLYNSVKITGSFPFLRHKGHDDYDSVTLDDVIVSSIFNSRRYKKLFSFDFDYSKLLFISLALSSLVDHIKATTPSSSNNHTSVLNEQNEKSTQPLRDNTTLCKVKVRSGSEPLINRIIWDSIPNFINLDGIDVNSVYINAKDLLHITTLFLILSSIQKDQKLKMQKNAYFLLKHHWKEFEIYSLAILKFIDITIDDKNINNKKVNFEQIFFGEINIVSKLIKHSFTRLFKHGFLSSIVDDNVASMEPHNTNQDKKKSMEFNPSKLVNYGSVAFLASVLQAAGSPILVSKENLFSLYRGGDSGFSIRSLELKIFKWNAPSVLFVSGKRLKNKTATTNRRYHQFDQEYPRFFRSQENHLKPWQDDSDRITYAVVVSQPWKLSNKKNFGDTETMIISMQPHLDFYKSNNSPVLKGELIYFNTLGLGLGVGNEQPIDRNGVKKYLPGDVSLTIEANLEFAVFRHTRTGNNQSTYFNKSIHNQLRHEDFEDRFMITDLEVWGIGSTKELEEQKKHWQWEQKQAEARQSVNLKRMGEERAFLEMVGLVGNHGGSGGSV